MNERLLDSCKNGNEFYPVCRSSERVSLFNWHRVLVSRRGKEASIRLDDESINQGRSLGPLSELNLELPFFIGGLR